MRKTTHTIIPKGEMMMELIQRYVSKELTHFVGRHQHEEERFELLVNIIKSGWILHKPMNANEKTNRNLVKMEGILEPEVVCFADIPINDLSLHMEKYSNFGIAFKKDFLVKHGANPVFYVTQNGNVNRNRLPKSKKEWFQENIKNYFTLKEKLQHLPCDDELAEVKNLFSKLDPFLVHDIFAYIKAFDASKSDADEDNYYLEREWRIVGDLPFSVDDITRILIPEKYGKPLRERLPEYYGQLSFTE